MNSESTEVVELGTKAFPYKSLSLVFIELLNYLSHQDITVNIYVLENTQNYLELRKNFIINITNVNILPYSTDGESPNYATLTLQDTTVTTLNPFTKFSLLQNDDRNTTIATTASFLEAAITGRIIFLVGSSFSIEKFNLLTDYKNQQ